MNWSEKNILVTGACGTVGSELLAQLLHNHKPASLIALDNDESNLFFLQDRFKSFSNFQCFLGDVRDRDKLCSKMRGIDIVFHVAAYKHVMLCERSPFEAVQTNIIGVQNIISAASDAGVEKVIFTSSDKAVNPTSVMGTSKLMGERLFTAASCNLINAKTIFASTRFGNVLGSNGSVVPIFKNQIRAGGPVTITDKQMTRFVMGINDAVRLIIDSAELAKGGEIFVTKMPTIKITDLASVMISELAPKFNLKPEDIKTEIIGTQPGEKMYEELLSSEEFRRTLEQKKYFIVLPPFRDLFQDVIYKYPDTVGKTVTKPYQSDQEVPLNQEELKKYLSENQLLDLV